MFITEGGGIEKSHYLKSIICMFLIKTMNLYSGSPDKPKALIPAPTGVATINISGTTINSGLSIPRHINEYTLPRLSDSERARLCDFYSEVAVVLLDEISIVSNIRLLHVHERFKKYFAA